MIEVTVQPTGDWAEAEDWAAARATARTLMREARHGGAGSPTAAFVIGDALHREGVSRSELGEVGSV